MNEPSQIPQVSAVRDTALDGIRGIACLVIYFYHTGCDIYAPPLVLPGFTGVSIFFVLSGYLMFGPFLGALMGDRTWPSLRQYSIRRFSRIYPPYLVALILFSLARYAGHLKPPSLANFLTHVLLIFNYFDWRDFFSINAVFWSLAVEAQFYLILPIAAWAAYRLARSRPRTAAMSVVLGFIVVGIVSRGLEFLASEGPNASDRDTRYMTAFSFLDLFGAGMAVAYFEREFSRRLGASSRARGVLIGSGLLIYFASNNWVAVVERNWMRGETLTYTMAFPFLNCMGIAVALLGLCTRPDRTKGLLTWRPLVALGMISYSLYLYHIGVQFVLNGRFKLDHIPFRISFGLVALVPTVIVSTIMYLIVERPAMRWGARYSLHKPAVQAAYNLTEMPAPTPSKSS
jgi:peptidoglycan/LPS O-acetylase OafA/YrhL